MKVIATLLISSLTIFSYIDHNPIAYGSLNKVIATDSLDKNIREQSSPKKLSLVLKPLKMLTSYLRYSEELQCFLINNTDTTTMISREDGTISHFESELFIKNKWIRFHWYDAATCGNSYWKQKLSAGHSLDINFGWRYVGKIKLPMRLSYNHQGKVIYSNTIPVMVSRDVYSYVKKNNKRPM
jgi:hypothetical protein